MFRILRFTLLASMCVSSLGVVALGTETLYCVFCECKEQECTKPHCTCGFNKDHDGCVGSNFSWERGQDEGTTKIGGPGEKYDGFIDGDCGIHEAYPSPCVWDSNKSICKGCDYKPDPNAWTTTNGKYGKITNCPACTRPS
jgi:hypothetical protein